MPSRHGGTLNSRRLASPLVSLVEGEERWEATDHSQDILLQNWGETELNHSVTCMVLKTTANDRRHSPCHDEFRFALIWPLPISRSYMRVTSDGTQKSDPQLSNEDDTRTGSPLNVWSLGITTDFTCIRPSTRLVKFDYQNQSSLIAIMVIRGN
ncbi:uncharacterized protein TNCV_83141 [Trichonephila clavipes]|nr:uncharacterized protein TNCV_83141 [Trichonephila clavipes]